MSRKRGKKHKAAVVAVPDDILAEGSGPVGQVEADAIATVEDVVTTEDIATTEDVVTADDVVATAVDPGVSTGLAPERPAPADAAGADDDELAPAEPPTGDAVDAAGDAGDADRIDDAELDLGADAASTADGDVGSGEGGEGDEDDVGIVFPTSAATMDAVQLKHLVEALIFASDRPLTVQRLRQLTRVGDVRRLEQALVQLSDDYRERGLILQQVSGGYQFRTRTQFSAWVQQLIAGRPVRLSRAQLETLAIIAYRQPITRPEIDDIRGVDSSATLKLLIDRMLIRILGKREEVGRPMLYGTTKEFLDFFSLGDLRELPTLREYSELTAESRKVMSDRLGIAPDGGGEGGEGGEGGGGGGGSGGGGGGLMPGFDDDRIPDDEGAPANASATDLADAVATFLSAAEAVDRSSAAAVAEPDRELVDDGAVADDVADDLAADVADAEAADAGDEAAPVGEAGAHAAGGSPHVGAEAADAGEEATGATEAFPHVGAEAAHVETARAGDESPHVGAEVAHVEGAQATEASPHVGAEAAHVEGGQATEASPHVGAEAARAETADAADESPHVGAETADAGEAGAHAAGGSPHVGAEAADAGEEAARATEEFPHVGAEAADAHTETARATEESPHVGADAADAGEETAPVGEAGAHAAGGSPHVGAEAADAGEETARATEASPHVGAEAADPGEETARATEASPHVGAETAHAEAADAGEEAAHVSSPHAAAEAAHAETADVADASPHVGAETAHAEAAHAADESLHVGPETAHAGDGEIIDAVSSVSDATDAFSLPPKISTHQAAGRDKGVLLDEHARRDDDGRVDGDAGWPAGSQRFSVIASIDDRPVERPVMDSHVIDAGALADSDGDAADAMASHVEPAAE